MALSDRQNKALKSKLPRQFVRSRVKGGRALAYLEGWYVVDQANRIFGFDGWDRVCLKQDLLWERRSASQVECAYTVRVRVQIHAGDRPVVRESAGFGISAAADAFEAHEMALKTAETDATKRALATFGNRFGLSLYDPEQRGVTRPKALKSASPIDANAAREATTADTHGPAEPALHTGATGVAASSAEPQHDGDLNAATPSAPELSHDAGAARPGSQMIALPASVSSHVDDLRQIAEGHSSGASATAVDTPDLRAGELPISPAGTEGADGPQPEPNPMTALAGLEDRERLAAGLSGETVAAEVSDEVDRTSDAEAASLRYLNALKKRLMATQCERDIDNALADSLVDLDIVKRAAPDLRTRKGVHFADLLTAFARKRKALFAAAEKQSRSPHTIAPSPKAFRTIARDRQAGLASEPDLIVSVDKSRLLIATPKRYRDKDHLKRVMTLPCLVCGRRPSHPHHLKFAQPSGLGLKVSDEFVVPLCALDHNALHRSGNELIWWKSVGIEPLAIAKALWSETTVPATTGPAL